MNQTCKVCGEPAAGFHFGAFTCEGCKSFFGRSYNNLSSITECKNNGECIINKKNRTSCKACRLRKCLLVGMSKSGSRYGRRSNWFKIHCLLQEQQQQQAANHHKSPPPPHPALTMLGHHQHQLDPRLHHQLASAMTHHHSMGRPTTKEDFMLLGLDEYKNSTSPSISSPESHNSDSSVEVSDTRLVSRGGLFLNNNHYPPHHHHPRNLKNCSDSVSPNGTPKDIFMPLHFTSLASLAPVFPHSATAFLPPGFPNPQQHPLLFPPTSYLYHQQQNILKTSNNNNRFTHNNNDPEMYSKRFFLDAVLQSQRSPSSGSTNKDDEDDDEDIRNEGEDSISPKHSPLPLNFGKKNTKIRTSLPSPVISQNSDDVQENPMDLSMKGCRIQNGRRSDEDGRSSSFLDSAEEDITDHEEDSHVEREDRGDVFRSSCEMTLKEHRSAPMDLTTKA
uniref:Nuclear receptor domain-containing protein n=1 Tax=Timema monikensis TaxID=170555 RepID=A0A7R9HK99_9NEOP|nr:unnamed protein product [Timema monikensis]